MRLHLESNMTCRAREQRGTPTQSSVAPPLRKPSRSFLDEGSAPPDLGRYMRLIAAGWMQYIVVVVVVRSTRHAQDPTTSRVAQTAARAPVRAAGALLLFVIHRPGSVRLNWLRRAKICNCQKISGTT